MQHLSLVFTILLVCVLGFKEAEAIPAHARRQLPNDTRLISLPLRRLLDPHKAVLHPQLLLQQHINRGSKRLARMTGRDEPSEHNLRSEMHKRLYLLEGGPGSRKYATPQASSFSKRRFRSGMAAGGKLINAGMPNASMPKNGSMSMNDATPIGIGVYNGTMGIGTGNGTVAAGNSTGSGVSPIDIQAAIKGGVTFAKPPTANDSLGLNIEADDVGYTATIQIGTPPRNFTVLMDSGSADFWVAGENCQSQQGDCGNHTILGPQSSSSFVQNNNQFEVIYGSGAVEGLLCHDDVSIAGLVLKNHTFGVATAESVQFAANSTPFDGIMGVAQSILSEEGVPTLVESLAQNGLIQAPIISFKIPRLADQLDDGDVTFGGLDTTKFIANTLVSFPNVNQEGFWEGAMDAITINGVNTGLTTRTSILDTGTTLILAPPEDAYLVMQGLGGSCDSQQCTIPCTTTASLALSFGNVSFPIEPRDLAVLPVDLNDPTGDCTAGIQPQQIGSATEWLVGDVFLKNAYFSTNVATNQISLAQLSMA